jgi:hypothetical protein
MSASFSKGFQNKEIEPIPSRRTLVRLSTFGKFANSQGIDNYGRVKKR